MSGELPEPWATDLAPKGIHSYRDLGRAADVGHETARRLVLGGRTSVGTVNQVADKLFGGDRNRVWRMHGKAVEDHGDWSLPAEASLLDDKQRELVKSIVLALAPSTDATPTQPPPEPEPPYMPIVRKGQELRQGQKKSPSTTTPKRRKPAS